MNLFNSRQDNPGLQEILAANLTRTRERISRALEKSSEPDRSVTLVAVSKKQPLEKILILAEHGQIHFGENYVQEALDKMGEIGQSGLKWHFIGGLQTNKAKYVAGKFSLVHSVDTLKLAQGLHKKAKSLDMVQHILIQVNLAEETQKYGVWENNLPSLARSILEFQHLKLDGLMVMPPFTDNAENSRPLFARARRLKYDLEQSLGIGMAHLSMGMSQDLEVAVEEGATLVRVGTSLLGSRADRTLSSAS